jgi:kinesin family protein 5
MPEANVKVICRFRPINDLEKLEGERPDAPKLEFPNDTTVTVITNKQPPQVFTFDKVFDWNSTQEQVYNLSAKDTIEDVLQGYNGTIFAYGQTGAGKSYTMFGPDISVPELRGIIPRSCEHIFNYIERDTSGTEFTIKCSFLEIYKEVIRDLLNPDKVNLKVRESPTRGVWVQDLTEEFVTCEEDIFELLKLGEKYRSVSATKMNAVSSRSHSLFIITLQQKSPEGSTKEGKLNLADLAGSEKVGKTGATGETLEEAKKINQSLSALGNCINALTKAKRSHIPYRDSKLTFILRESLGGNSKTTLLIACSPHPYNIEETISTLKFGQRAKSLKNRVTINQQKSVAELNAIIAKLTAELESLRRYAAKLEKDILLRDPKYDLNKVREECRKEAQALLEGDDEQQQTRDVTVTDDKENKEGGEISPRPTATSQQQTVNPSLNSGPNESETSAAKSATNFLSSYNPMALVEAQVLLEQTKERTRLEIQDLKDEINSLKDDLQQRETQITNFKKLIEQKDREITHFKSLLESEREEHKMRYSKLEYDAVKNSLELEHALEEIKTLQQTNTNLQDELNKTRESLSSFETDCETKKNEIMKLKEELKQIKSELLRHEKQIATEKENASTIARERDSLKLRLGLTEEKSKQQERELQDLMQQLVTIQKQYQELTVDIQGTQNAIDAPNGSKRTTDEDKSQLENVKKMVTELKKQNLVLQSEIARKEIDIKELHKKLQQQELSLKEANEENNQLKDEYHELKATTDEKITSLEMRLRQLEDELNEEQAKRINAESEVRAHKRLVAAQEKRIRNLQETNESIKKEFSSQLTTYTRLVQQANQRVKELEKACDELHVKNEDLKSKLDGSVEAYVQMQKKLTDRLIQQDEQLALLMSDRELRQNRTASGKRNIVVPLQANNVRKLQRKEQKESPNRSFWAWLFGSSNKKPMPTREQLLDCKIEGYLFQLTGVFKSWKERWFVLKDTTLYYFDSKESTEADGLISVEGCTVAVKKDVESGSQHKYQFTISHPSRKTIHLCAQTLNEMTIWIEAIDAAATGGSLLFFAAITIPIFFAKSTFFRSES